MTLQDMLKNSILMDTTFDSCVTTIRHLSSNSQIQAQCCEPYQAIPGESPNTILTNKCVVGSNGERTS